MIWLVLAIWMAVGFLAGWTWRGVYESDVDLPPGQFFDQDATCACAVCSKPFTTEEWEARDALVHATEDGEDCHAREGRR